jgi:mono/diheme cytochrome c family protein
VIQRTILILAAALLAGASFAQDQGPLPQGPGVDLVYAKCQQCHGINYTVNSAGLPDFLWADTIDLMIQLGMQVTEEEEQILYDYLTTYLGTEPPPEPAADAAQADQEVDGQQVYATNCQSCHQADGSGIPGGFPPVAQHAADLAVADRAYLPLVILYGLNGEIVVDGETYNGVMPPWPQLSDAQIAEVLNYSVIEWDAAGTLPPNFQPYTAEEIAEQRGRGLSGADVLEARPDVQ